MKEDRIRISDGHIHRIQLFSLRTLREILRDPLSFVFCLGVPLVMLVAMYLLFSPSATWFTLDVLTPGIAVFSGTFTMLYMALLVSRDRSTWFLTRLYSSPLTDGDFVFGYALPGILIGAGQLVICWIAAIVTGICTGATDWISIGILYAGLSDLPMVFSFVALGILFGSLFSDKAAPGLSSVIISAAGFLSGAWMPIETMPAWFRNVCSWLPFYPAVRAGRTVLSGHIQTSAFWRDEAVTIGYAAVLATIAVLAFRYQARKDAA